MTPSRGVSVTSRRDQRIADLYAQYAPGAARLAYLLTGDRDLAEDITQDAFTKILGRFGELKSPDAFRAYLRTTVLNLARGHFRKLRTERSWRDAEASQAPRQTVQPDVAERDAVWARVSALPYRQRAALVLRFYEDLSENQAAEALACSPAAVKSLVARAMETMRAQVWTEEG